VLIELTHESEACSLVKEVKFLVVFVILRLWWGSSSFLIYDLCTIIKYILLLISIYWLNILRNLFLLVHLEISLI